MNTGYSAPRNGRCRNSRLTGESRADGNGTARCQHLQRVWLFLAWIGPSDIRTISDTC